MRPVGERGKHRGTIKDGPGGSKRTWARLPKLVIARIAKILRSINSNSGNFGKLRVVAQFHFFAGDKAGTLVILNPLQRVKNPQAALPWGKSSGFFALRAQNDNSRIFS